MFNNPRQYPRIDVNEKVFLKRDLFFFEMEENHNVNRQTISSKVILFFFI